MFIRRTYKTYTTEELKTLVKEYLSTLDNKEKNDWYETNYIFALGELTRFIKWLENRK